MVRLRLLCGLNMLRNSRSWAAEEQNSAGDVLNSGLGPVGKTKPYNIARVRGTQKSITASSCAVSGHITSQQKKHHTKNNNNFNTSPKFHIYYKQQTHQCKTDLCHCAHHCDIVHHVAQKAGEPKWDVIFRGLSVAV